MTKRLREVVASDPSADYITFATEPTAALGSMGNVAFEQARAEDLAYLNGVNTNSVRTSDGYGGSHFRLHKCLEAWENPGYMILRLTHLCRRRNGTVSNIIQQFPCRST